MTLRVTHPLHTTNVLMNIALSSNLFRQGVLKICHYGIITALLSASTVANAEIYRYIDPQGRLLFTDQLKHSGYIRLEKTFRGWEPVKPYRPSTNNKETFSPAIKRAAQQHQLSHHLLHAIISVESAYNPNARSKVGAQGLMQLMPATADRFHVDDPYNPYQNIEGGSKYFKHLLTLFDEDIKLALAAYNAGENTVKKYGNQIPPYKETKNYVEKVLKQYNNNKRGNI